MAGGKGSVVGSAKHGQQEAWNEGGTKCLQIESCNSFSVQYRLHLWNSLDLFPVLDATAAACPRRQAVGAVVPPQQGLGYRCACASH